MTRSVTWWGQTMLSFVFIVPFVSASFWAFVAFTRSDRRRELVCVVKGHDWKREPTGWFRRGYDCWRCDAFTRTKPDFADASPLTETPVLKRERNRYGS